MPNDTSDLIGAPAVALANGQLGSLHGKTTHGLDVNGDGAIDLFIGTCTGTKIFIGVPDIGLFADGFESGDTRSWSDTAD